jgi:hypothetical protein
MVHTRIKDSFDGKLTKKLLENLAPDMKGNHPRKRRGSKNITVQ